MKNKKIIKKKVDFFFHKKFLKIFLKLMSLEHLLKFVFFCFAISFISQQFQKLYAKISHRGGP